MILYTNGILIMDKIGKTLLFCQHFNGFESYFYWHTKSKILHNIWTKFGNFDNSVVFKILLTYQEMRISFKML